MSRIRLSARDRDTQQNRTQLFAGSPYSGTPYGGTPAGSGRSSPFAPSVTSQGGQRFAEDLEGQNDERLDGLSAKVKILKEISIGIGHEIKDSTVQLSQMNDAFAETSGILSGTFQRMNTMATRQGGRWACHMIFFFIVMWIFILVWWFRR